MLAKPRKWTERGRRRLLSKLAPRKERVPAMARERARHMRPLGVGAWRVGSSFCREAEVRGSFLVFARGGVTTRVWFERSRFIEISSATPGSTSIKRVAYICDSINAIMSFGRGTVARPRL